MCDLAGGGRETPDLARSLAAMTLGGAAAQRQSSLRRRVGAVFGRCDESQLAEGVLPSGPALVLFEGRLDNRTQVLAALGQDDRSAGASNAEIALSAYGRWGAAFADRLIGEFACAVWEEAARRLILARDALGARPLFFWRGGDRIFFATEPRGLLAQPDIPQEIDHGWVARWVALLPQIDGRTFHRGIERVMPGHALVADPGGVRSIRYWRPENLPPIRFERDADYVEAMRTLFEEAVRCRIASDRPIGSHLSAGFDSSTVTLFAARQLAARGRRLTAFTAVPTGGFGQADYPDRLGDEGPLAAMTAARCANIDHVTIPNLSGDVFAAMDRASWAMDAPILNPFNQIWINTISEAARARGIVTLLTGQMGNMTISYDGLGWLTQLAQQGQWRRLAREILALNRHGMPWTALVNQYLVSRLPPGLRRWVRASLRRPEVALEEFSAIRPDFAARLGLAEEARDTAGNMMNTDLGRIDVRLAVLARVDIAMFLRGQKRLSGVDLLDPTMDRRLVEFCLAIPGDQFLKDGQTRSLVRRMMSGVLPEPVMAERRKGLQAIDWHVGATAALGEMKAEIARLERSPLASECLDLKRLRHLVETWPSGGWHRRAISYPYHLALSRGLAAGRFIRKVEGGNG